MDTLLVFRTQNIDSTTTPKAVDGSMHIGAFKLDDVINYSVLLNSIIIIFSVNQTLSNDPKNAANKPSVKLKIRPGFEYRTLIALHKFLQTTTAPVVFFDNVREQFPIENIQEVTLISST
tara:strand:+ start:9608 stop:9967 length:360 start_codon:yes stop_codon:yes gene_type:complete